MSRQRENIVRNYMEDCVEIAMDQVLPGLKICLCENCKSDITAMALNDLPPKYVVTRKGQLYTKLDTLQKQFGIDVTTAVIKAAEFVSKRPRHEEAD
jgi:competence protein ComFB